MGGGGRAERVSPFISLEQHERFIITDDEILSAVSTPLHERVFGKPLAVVVLGFIFFSVGCTVCDLAAVRKASFPLS